MNVTIDIEQLIIFFDEKPPKSIKHATSISQLAGEEIGLGLLAHYLRSSGRQVKLLSRKCTTGKNKGPRLDAWIQIIVGKKRILYQVEVKNWSAHAIGGKRLLINAEQRDISAHKIERWNREWRNGDFVKRTVRKVLVSMKPPAVEYDSIEPCVCFWDAMHPKGKDEPFFHVKPRNSAFSLVHIFSMSSYLRTRYNEGIRTIELDMPQAIQRISWLDKIFAIH